MSTRSDPFHPVSTCWRQGLSQQSQLANLPAYSASVVAPKSRPGSQSATRGDGAWMVAIPLARHTPPVSHFHFHFHSHSHSHSHFYFQIQFTSKSTCTSARCAPQLLLLLLLLLPLPFLFPLPHATRHTSSDSTETPSLHLSALARCSSVACQLIVVVLSFTRSTPPALSTRLVPTPNPFPHPHALSSILTSLTFSYLVLRQVFVPSLVQASQTSLLLAQFLTLTE
ncbi:hypothetical protein B0J13DRAFT_102388 [Dactylonectria estremocensis]|uniref:Uncharacterized protein n=1 Tax=Dactylonectria estremocensis TaxID=1079267 RepID=A0A9P9ISC3_9HYPO|nr:hypothetical protein B0J13DRAFT_102388 [Dactylonectria estremocensis]